MENQHYVGIDISKKTLDWARFDGQKILCCVSTENSATGIRSALSQMGEIPGYIPQKTIFCMEYTARRTVGIYNAHIMEVMYRFGLPIWLENSTQIKQATGIGQRPEGVPEPGCGLYLLSGEHRHYHPNRVS